MKDGHGKQRLVAGEISVAGEIRSPTFAHVVALRRRMEEFTVGSAEVRALLGGLAALGFDAVALQRAVDLEPSLLHDPEARAPESMLLAMWLAAEATWDKGLLGLHAGSKVPAGAFEVLDYLAGASPTIGGSFRRLAEYSAIANTGLPYAIAPPSPPPNTA
jgi:hypothetical protein